MKLKNIKPTITLLSPTLGRLPDNREGAGSRDRVRDATQPWRKWYKTARWQKLAARMRQRDGNICRQTGVMLIGKAPAPNSAVVDHRIPHHGDERLFWDEENLQTVSKHWHDSHKQREERRSGW